MVKQGERLETERDVVEFEGGEKTLDRSVKALALLAGISLMWLMFLVCYAVFMRRVFNAPPLGGDELAALSLVPIVFLGFAYCGWTGGHIAVDLIGNVIKGRALQLLDVGVRLVCALFFIVVTWMTVIHGLDALEFGDEFNLLPIPHWPFYFVIAFGSGVFTFVLFLLAARSACGLPEIKVK